MPTLDVTEVLDSPEFLDTSLVCKRRTQAVGADGVAAVNETSTSFAGVVVNPSAQDLDRRPDGSVLHGTIGVYTRFRLTSGAGDIDSDEVIWQGRRYTVVGVDDWSTYGAGFVNATCRLKPLGNA